MRELVPRGPSQKWSGGEHSRFVPNCNGPGCDDIDSTSLMWDFFKRYRRDDVPPAAYLRRVGAHSRFVTLVGLRGLVVALPAPRGFVYAYTVWVCSLLSEAT